MLGRFKEHLKNTFPDIGQKKLLIACSGGLDSMVLAHLTKTCDLNIALAHCNYKLRGKASDLDEALVKDWAQSNNTPFFSKNFDLQNQSGSIQLKARELRYGWFKELLESEGFDKILTAHHADDKLETFLINLSRGTGLEGLSGIPQNNFFLYRPLLPFTKDEILAYAEASGIKWREDESNSGTKYLRNQLRHNVIPSLKETNTSFLTNFNQTQTYLGLSGQLLKNYENELKERLFKKDGEEIYIAISALKKLHPLNGYLYLLFKTYGFTQWTDLKGLLDGQSGKEIQSTTHRLIKNRESLILSVLSKKASEEYEFNEGEHRWSCPIQFLIEEVDAIEEHQSNSVYVDKEKLAFPLKLRKWRVGDYFYPLGLMGRKKISKFFKDEKYSVVQKEAQWLLLSNDKIVWVLGKRLDDRFKVSSGTKAILKLTWLS